MNREIIDKVEQYYRAAMSFCNQEVSEAEDNPTLWAKAVNNYINACVVLEIYRPTMIATGLEGSKTVLTKPFNAPELYAAAQVKPPSEDEIRQTLLWLADRIQGMPIHADLVRCINHVRENLEAYLSAQDLMPDEAKQINQAFRDLTQCYFQPADNHRKDEDHLRMIAYFLDDWDHLLNRD